MWTRSHPCRARPHWRRHPPLQSEGHEPVRLEPGWLEKTEVPEAGKITNMRFRFAGQGREFTAGYTKRTVL
ncbi:hypothetical protein BQ8794_30482 [Mesorhizobium prunaredense]|uniref:Uncharacterized protein n=1 Tax=Mesorhizobium prunaredense TaxID=1631249 RepID=A0A1R3VAW4_9HYPH|nr:hypothetical protein BQ8794_30482 [Mesorhizobium prunaredense]